jgi:hypothetical protein
MSASKRAQLQAEGEGSDLAIHRARAGHHRTDGVGEAAAVCASQPYINAYSFRPLKVYFQIC